MGAGLKLRNLIADDSSRAEIWNDLNFLAKLDPILISRI
jgi:hypothetical protein